MLVSFLHNCLPLSAIQLQHTYPNHFTHTSATSSLSPTTTQKPVITVIKAQLTTITFHRLSRDYLLVFLPDSSNNHKGNNSIINRNRPTATTAAETTATIPTATAKQQQQQQFQLESEGGISGIKAPPAAAKKNNFTSSCNSSCCTCPSRVV